MIILHNYKYVYGNFIDVRHDYIIRFNIAENEIVKEI